MSIFPNCEKKCQGTGPKWLCWCRKFWTFWVVILPPLKIRASGQSLNDRNKIANERQVNKRYLVDRHICQYVHVYISPSSLIFEIFFFGGGGHVFAKVLKLDIYKFHYLWDLKPHMPFVIEPTHRFS